KLRGRSFALRSPEADAVGERQPFDLQTRNAEVHVGSVGYAIVGEAGEIETELIEGSRRDGAVIGGGGGDVQRFGRKIAQGPGAAGSIGGSPRDCRDVGADGDGIGCGGIVVNASVVLVAGRTPRQSELRKGHIRDAVQSRACWVRSGI